MGFRYSPASAIIYLTFRHPFIGSAVNAAANQLLQVPQNTIDFQFLDLFNSVFRANRLMSVETLYTYLSRSKNLNDIAILSELRSDLWPVVQ